MTTKTTAQALACLVGPGALLTAPEDIAPYVTDYRKLYRGDAAAVVLPSSTEEVAAVMKWCHDHDVPVVPQGGNTSLMGGAVPEPGAQAVVISLKRMNRVLAIDAINDTLTLQAGVTLTGAREAAEGAGRLFPLRIGSEGSCQIGGNLATNAGGTAVLRYGNMRDLVLGIEAVLPDGRVYSQLRGLRKDNTGYDLKHLFIGSEGTLGIITAAVLKLMPAVRSTATAFVAVQDPAAAVQLLARAKALAGPTVTTFELISRPALDLVVAYLGNGAASPLQGAHDWMVLIELTSSSPDAQALDASLMQVLEAGMEEGWVLDAAVAQSGADQQAFWRLREEISDAQTRTGGSIKCDVSVPLSRIAEFVGKAIAMVKAAAPDARMVVYGHMGDGNVHFNPLRPADMPAKDFLAANYERVSHAVDGLAHSYGGSVSAEHGIGVSKRDDLPLYKQPVELELMWQVKKALDPKGLLNPAKLLPRIP
jgi:FAD/FMN-containing dehydrogenase